MTGKYFCPLPFSHMEIDPLGEIRPCCMYSGFVTDDAGNRFNAAKHGFADVFDSAWYKRLRQKMLNDQPDVGCNSCYQEESNSIQSRRQRELVRMSQKFDSTDGNLVSLDIKLGNVCNLQCVICNPFSSSKLLEEQIRIGMMEKPTKEQYDKFKWYNNDTFWEQLLAYGLTNITDIDIMGGEPMLAKKHFSFLTRLVDSGHANHIRINYVTNGTIWPAEIIESLLPKFKSVNITLSADGIGSVYEYTRYPGKWETFVTNMRKYKSHGFPITISYSVSAYSLFDIFKSMDFYHTEGVKVWFNFVYNEDRSIQCLPKEVKTKFIQMYLKQNKVEWNKTYQFSSLESIIKFMMDSDLSLENWPKFVTRTSLLDKSRKNDILNVIPELKGYYAHQV